jgi:large subunit ribosomal protein L25
MSWCSSIPREGVQSMVSILTIDEESTIKGRVVEIMRTILQAYQRPHTNRTGLKRLRREGRLPGVIFGSEQDNAMIHLSAKEFRQFLRTGGSAMIELQLEGTANVPVLLEGLQRDPITKEPIHVDFLQVSEDKIVRTNVVLEYVGTARGIRIGGVVQIQSSSIEVRSLPGRVPSLLAVDIGNLDLGDTLFAGDLTLPAGVELMSADNELLVSITK